MDLGLRDKVVFVAGSSRGIGKSIATTFLEEGARVCISGRDQTTLVETERELSRTGQVIAFRGDLSHADRFIASMESVLSRWGQLDALVANVGTGRGMAGWNQPDEEWDRLFRLNFQTSTRLAQAAIPELAKTQGSIVFISSITGVEATLAPLPYSAAKAALINYAKNLARQVAKDGLRVNCIAPGNILFPGGSWEERLKRDRDGVMQRIHEEVPMNRFGTPEEVASLAVFLCSSRASFITGSCFVADGGQTRSL